MYGATEDYVITYDCNLLQEHIYSSDFEESCSPLVDSKKGKHNLVKTKKKKTKTRTDSRFRAKKDNVNNTARLYMDCDEYPVKLKEDANLSCPKETENKYAKQQARKHKPNNRETIDLNSGDQAEPFKKKLSLIKHKVIPCISGIFKRNNFAKHHMSIIEENQDENTRINNCNCCQHYNNCEQRPLKKLYKRQQDYVVQPIYSIEGNSHKTPMGPFATTKITVDPSQHHNHQTKNQYSSYYSLSSSESDSQCAHERQQKVESFRKTLKSEIMKEHMKYQQNQQIRTRQVQYPSKERRYHVFRTPIHSTSLARGYNDHSISKIPSSTSSFWEYLYDKTTVCGRKYQRVEMPVQYGCTAPCGTSAYCPTPNADAGKGVKSYENVSMQGQKMTCACQKNNRDSYCEPNKIQSGQGGQGRRCNPRCSKDTMAKASDINISTSPGKKDSSTKMKPRNRVQCQCSDKGKKSSKSGSKNSDDYFPGSKGLQGSHQNVANQNRPCQEGHDEIVSSLAQKYNGEILCIHNPPCILINGCLNLPPQKEQQQQNNEMAVFPVTGSSKHNFYEKMPTTNQTHVFREQSCQYHVEVSQATDYRAEKLIQSICYHNPPCQVVRGCCKPKFDPQLENSCVHVPLCKVIPECVVRDRGKRSCEHRPRCRDIPICSRNFVMLTAKENIATQAESLVAGKESLICRHEPPCIMVPKCIGNAMCDSSYVNVDAIPGCIHQPSCPLIPACCRKSAKLMVSVASQYPNSCRIV